MLDIRLVNVDRINSWSFLPYRTSRGVPERLRIFTTTWQPFASSNERRAGEESTRIHRRVSSTAEETGVAVAGLEALERGEERWRDVRRRSKST
jgi:hypothetical protein